MRAKELILPTLNSTQFAKLCGVSAGRVTQWCDEGMPCERKAQMGSPVSIDLVTALPWVVHRRKSRSGHFGDD